MSSPLTLEQVRKHRERAHEWMSVGCPQGCENCHHSDFPCSDRTTDLMAATIEWLVERIGQALCDEVLTEECKDDCRLCLEAMDDLSEWMRGKA